MKKTLFALSGFLFITLVALAQEDGSNLAKQAGEALTSYHIDPTANAAKLDEAKQKIDQALQLADAQAVAPAWITKGDIYNSLLQRDMAKRLIPGNEKAPLSGDNDALVAFDGYKKGFETPTAKKH